MGSDRARITFDPTREYRSVVAQQGRVTLEADVNEQAMIAAEALRVETIDVVGPAGTPNNGYQVTTDGNNNLTVGIGTMYLGGWRLENDAPIPVASQLEWLDQPAPSTIPSETNAPANQVVALHVIEQSISAVEDQALLEVALGGPDTTARTRLMQHIVEFPTSASTCQMAAAVASKQFIGEGLTFDPLTCSIAYEATLQVIFSQPGTSTDPCCPAAQGGYLGSDNQLIQLAVTSVSAGSGTLLWGWNNASFLYRATAVAGSSNVVRLSQAPIDAAHTPQPGQTVEILQTTMVLGDPADNNFVAAPQGLVVTLDSGKIYDPSTQQLTLPASTTLPSDPNTLFVRLWQATGTFSVGAATQLASLPGLTFTINLSALPTAPFSLRPYWNFALRPNTPQQLYPARLHETPQPPDGPRQWLCDLAIFTPGALPGPVTPDCRIPFLPLTDLGACDCCAITLDASQDWQGKLSAAIASSASALSICFEPGEFKATTKFLFSEQEIKITGAGWGTAISSDNLECILEFDSCSSVTLSDITVGARLSGYTPGNNTQNLQGAVTFSNCLEVNVDRCGFSCANNNLRSAACLTVANTPSSSSPVALPIETVVRITNSRFLVGNCQVGILLINADRAWIENNIVETKYELLGITKENLASNTVLASHLAKQLIREMSIVDTATKTTKTGKRKTKRTERKKERGATHSVDSASPAPLINPAEKPTEPSAQPNSSTSGAPAEDRPAAPPTPDAPATSSGPKLITPVKLPHINLGLLGRAHVTANFGTIQLKFISSSKLTNAWTDAIRNAGLNQDSTMGAIRIAVKKIALNAVKNTSTAPQAFRNYVANILPQLYSTSSQGIVVGGNLATEIRILNNRIGGTAQGIHVGLCNMKQNPALTLLQVQQLRIIGNSIAVQLTPSTTQERHGIYVGGVASGLISENDLSLTRTGDAGQAITGIDITHTLGVRTIIERNTITGFTTGIAASPGSGSSSSASLRLASGNYSDAANTFTGFATSNNLP